MFGRLKLINRDKELFLKELEAWKSEQRFAAKKEVDEYNDSAKRQIHELALSCANDTKNYEHTYHHNMENLGIAIAKLEAKKEALEEIMSQDKTIYNKMIEHKDAEIKRLNHIIEKLVSKDPAPITINNNK
jgi:hypothetical protein